MTAPLEHYHTRPADYRRSWLLSTLAILICLGSAWLFPPAWSLEPLPGPTWQPSRSLLLLSWVVLGAPLLCALALLLTGDRLPTRRIAIGMLLMLLLMLGLWPPLLLRLGLPSLALLDASLLWLLCIGCVASTARLQPIASWCLLPVLVWVSGAVVLNGVVVALN